MCANHDNHNHDHDHNHVHNGNGNGNGNGHKKYETGTVEIPPVSGGTMVRGFEKFVEATINEQPHIHEQTEIWTGDKEQYERIENAIHDLLDAFNVNWEDPNYTETPKRVAKAFMEYWVSGYGRKPEDEITVFPNSSGSNDLVMVKDMKFYSLCSHHLAPFDGYAAIAYVPNKDLLGLSKLGRILDIYARRFQLQERIGAQVADKLMELIAPQGVIVILYDAEHKCMSSRGVQLHDANTTTVAARGIFETDRALRNEVMSLLQK